MIQDLYSLQDGHGCPFLWKPSMLGHATCALQPLVIVLRQHHGFEHISQVRHELNGENLGKPPTEF